MVEWLFMLEVQAEWVSSDVRVGSIGISKHQPNKITALGIDEVSLILVLLLSPAPYTPLIFIKSTLIDFHQH
jgi:hypothetical protein